MSCAEIHRTNSKLEIRMWENSEIRISKSETNSNVQISNDSNAKSWAFDFCIGMIRLKHWGFGFRICFGCRDSDFKFREPYV
jgi:hypothetical protein